jgi:hypothetical protein
MVEYGWKPNNTLTLCNDLSRRISRTTKRSNYDLMYSSVIEHG